MITKKSHLVLIFSLIYPIYSRANNIQSPAFQYLPSSRHVSIDLHKNFPTHDRLQRVPPFCRLRSSPGSTENLPDYGKTSVDVDQHMLDVRKRWRRPELFGTSIVSDTLSDIQADADRTIPSTIEMTKEQRLKRRRALDSLGITSFNQYVSQQLGGISKEDGHHTPILTRKQPKVLQLNIGLYCNQACNHCHVESSPLRKEMMSSEVASQCLQLLKNTPSIQTLDITGGAPELNAQFRVLVSMARSLRPDNLDIIDRCNLTVLQEPGQEDLINFLVQHKVHIIASLPCYSETNVDAQRGVGVFDRSISALIALNDAGYGQPGSGLHLDLVYNPLGGFLPPEQKKLEAKYKDVLLDNFGIVFNSLFTITNLPIKRFADFLYERGELEQYMELLVRNFNVQTLDHLMCLDTISVGWDGKLYDCDFNQQLGYGIGPQTSSNRGIKSVFDIENLNELQKCDVKTDNHCFGCTAGKGSSCGGEVIS